MEAPKRKHIRLKNYDYSQNGAYFVTICTKGRQCLLSEIVRPQMVGEESVGRGLAPAGVRLTDWGRLVEEELFALTERYPSVWLKNMS